MSDARAAAPSSDVDAPPNSPGTPRPTAAPPRGRSRRAFLGAMGGATLAAVVADLAPGSTAVGAPTEQLPWDPLACTLGPERWQPRADRVIAVRQQAMQLALQAPFPGHPCNADDALYPNHIASFSKALPHNGLGEVDPVAYAALLRALDSGWPGDFERIPLGGGLRLVNPQAAFALELEGPDSHQLALPPAPTFASAEEAAEMAEMYWMALCRDVPFQDYATHPLTTAAAIDLSRYAGFEGPKIAGQVRPATLFRADFPGVLDGPYISQFLWLDAPFGTQSIGATMRTVQPGVDYLTRYADWLMVQNGQPPPAPTQYDTTRRYIRNGRDLGQWVHIDVLFQAYFNATLILLGMGAPLDPANPYVASRTQVGFATLGDPYVASLVGAVASRALKSVWFQKWAVHRRLRPEEFGGRIHHTRVGSASYPIHRDILQGAVLDRIFSRQGTYLLPIAFPEGCPAHPAYGAGHATVAGACVTVLKAFFDDTALLPSTVVVAPDGLSKQPYAGVPLTVGGELNKLAVNIAMGRNIAGVHWRSDATESLRLGEEIGIRFLREEKLTYNELFAGFSLTRFDGTRIIV